MLQHGCPPTHRCYNCAEPASDPWMPNHQDSCYTLLYLLCKKAHRALSPKASPPSGLPGPVDPPDTHPAVQHTPHAVCGETITHHRELGKYGFSTGKCTAALAIPSLRGLAHCDLRVAGCANLSNCTQQPDYVAHTCLSGQPTHERTSHHPMLSTYEPAYKHSHSSPPHPTCGVYVQPRWCPLSKLLQEECCCNRASCTWLPSAAYVSNLGVQHLAVPSPQRQPPQGVTLCGVCRGGGHMGVCSLCEVGSKGLTFDGLQGCLA
jgi:hypothetical protein